MKRQMRIISIVLAIFVVLINSLSGQVSKQEYLFQENEKDGTIVEWAGLENIQENNSIFSQNDIIYSNNSNQYRLVEKLQTIWRSSYFENLALRVYSYNEIGLMDTDHEQWWKDTYWGNNSITRYTYSDRGLLARTEFAYWIDGAWRDEYIETYTYDQDGNLIEKFRSQEEDGQWIDRRYTYLRDSDQNLTYLLIEKWEDGVWINVNETTYEYDANGNRTLYHVRHWENGRWVNYYKINYTHDAYGKEILRISEFWREGGYWEYSGKVVSVYDQSHIRLTYTEYIWREDHWENAHYSNLFYDAYGNLIKNERFEWKNGAWQNCYNLDYTYEQVPSPTVTSQNIDDHLKATLEQQDAGFFQNVYDTFVSAVGGPDKLTSDATVSLTFSNAATISSVSVHLVSPDNPGYEQTVPLTGNPDGSYSQRFTVTAEQSLDYTDFFLMIEEFIGLAPAGGFINPFTRIGYQASRIQIDRIDVTCYNGSVESIDRTIDIPRYDRTVQEKINNMLGLNKLGGYVKTVAFSPVDLCFSDPYGNKTGLNNGTTFSDIPYTVSSGDAEPEILMIIGGDAYELTVQGTGQGTFDLECLDWRISDEVVETNIQFNDVEVTPTAVCNTEIGGASPDYNLYVDVDGDGNTDLTVEPQVSTSVEKRIDSNAIPNEFILFHNYPNPFNPATTFRYDIPKDANVRIAVYNIYGQEVADLVNKMQNAGSYQLTWDAAELPSGTYLIRLQAGSFVQMRKCVLMK